MTPEVKAAIGRLRAIRADGKEVVGSAFFVGRRYLLTAFHVIGDRVASAAKGAPALHGELWFEPMGLEAERVSVKVIEGANDAVADWALLEASSDFPGIRPLPLGEIAESEMDRPQGKLLFETWGFPRLASMTGSGVAITGSVQDRDAQYQDTWTYQLYSENAAAALGDPLNGLSGAPCLVDGAVVGIIRSNLVAQAGPGVSAAPHIVGGILYACPLATTTLQDRCAAYGLVLDPIRGLPGLPRQNLPIAPFRYLHWYGSEHAEVFFGRNRRVRSLYFQVTNVNTPAVTLLYGASGIGKSSLLEAGLLPRLSRYHEINALRRDASRRLADTFGDALDVARASSKRTGRPVLIVLDQIEEVFTDPKYDGNAEVALLAQRIRTELTQRNDHHLKIILSFRSEWLASVRTRLTDEGLSVGEFYLERLDRDEIEEIVRGIKSTERLRQYYQFSVDKDLPRRVADDLLEDPSSPVSPILSIILTRMWNEARGSRADSWRLCVQNYEERMRSRLDLNRFLAEQLDEVAKTHPKDVASGLVIDVLQRHTTSYGTATELSGAEIEKLYADSASGGRAEHVVNVMRALSANSLLYSIENNNADLSGERSGVTRLAHDTLAPLVRAYYDTSVKPGQRAERILQSRVQDWDLSHPETGLIDPVDLTVVENGKSGMRAWTEREASLIAASAVSRDRSARRGTIVKGLGVLAVALVACLSLVAFNYARKANVALSEANAAEAAARSNQARAATGAILSSMNTETTPNPGVEILRENLSLLENSAENYPSLTSAAYRSLAAARIRPTVHDFSGGNWRMVSSKINFSPDSSLITVPLYNTWAAIIDRHTKRIINKLISPWKVIHKLEFNRAGTRLFLMSFGNGAVYDARTSQLLHAIKDCQLDDKDCADIGMGMFSPSGDLITAHSDGLARIWDRRTFELRRRIGTQRKEMRHAELNEDGSIALLHYGTIRSLEPDSDHEEIKVVSTADNKVLYSYPPPDDHRKGSLLAKFLGSKFLFVIDSEARPRLLDLTKFETTISVDEQIRNFAFDANGGLLALIVAKKEPSEDNLILIDLATSTRSDFSVSGCGTFNNISVSNKTIALSSAEGILCTIDSSTGERRASHKTEGGAILQIALSPDGQTLVAASADNTVRVWSMRDFEELITATRGSREFRDKGATNGSSVLLSGYGSFMLLASNGEIQLREKLRSSNISVSQTGLFLLDGENGCVVVDPVKNETQKTTFECQLGPDIFPTDVRTRHFIKIQNKTDLVIADVSKPLVLDTTRPLLADKPKQPAWLGISVGEAENADYPGRKRVVTVQRVEDGSPAAQAGIAVGDVITVLNGTEIERSRDLANKVKEFFSGDVIDVTLERNRQSLTKRVILGAPKEKELPLLAKPYVRAERVEFDWASFDHSSNYVIARGSNSVFVIPFSSDAGTGAVKSATPFLEFSVGGDVGVAGEDGIFWTKESSQEIIVWRADGERAKKLKNIHGSAAAVRVFSDPHSKLIGFSLEDNSVHVRSLVGLDTQLTIPERPNPIASLSFAAGDQYVTAAGRTGDVGIWSTRTGIEVAHIDLPVKCVSLDGRTEDDPSSCLGAVLFVGDSVLIQKNIQYSNSHGAEWLRWAPDPDVWKSSTDLIPRVSAAALTWKPAAKLPRPTFVCDADAGQNEPASFGNWKEQIADFNFLWEAAERSSRSASVKTGASTMIARCRQVLERKPNDGSAWFSLYAALGEAGEFDKTQDALNNSAIWGNPFGLHAMADALIIGRWKGRRSYPAATQLYAISASKGIVLSDIALSMLKIADGLDPDFCGLRRIADSGEPISNLLLAELLSALPGAAARIDLPLYDGEMASIVIMPTKRDLPLALKFAITATRGLSETRAANLGKRASSLAWSLGRTLSVSNQKEPAILRSCEGAQ